MYVCVSERIHECARLVKCVCVYVREREKEREHECDTNLQATEEEYCAHHFLLFFLAVYIYIYVLTYLYIYTYIHIRIHILVLTHRDVICAHVEMSLTHRVVIFHRHEK